MQKHLDMLLEKYGVDRRVTLIDDRHAEIDGQKIPTLPWRSERRFEELKRLVDSKTVEGISVLRIISIAHKGEDIYALLAREMDICRYILSTEISELFVLREGAALNASLKLESGALCTIELGATLPFGQPPISKHEIITARGIACDMNVDTQAMQSSIYVYGEKNESFTDVDFELFGLNIDEVATVRAAFAAARDEKVRTLCLAENAVLERLIAAAEKSIETLENIKL